MQVRTLKLFSDGSGTHSPGEVYEAADDVAALRIKAGLVAPVREGAESAAFDPEQAERAVMRPPARKRKP